MNVAYRCVIEQEFTHIDVILAIYHTEDKNRILHKENATYFYIAPQ